jgi:hypothetical protein
LAPPRFVSSTNTSMTLIWREPLYNGGCPITSYAVFRDDGSTMIPTTEINTSNDPAVRNISTLRTVNATLSNSDLGLTFTF